MFSSTVLKEAINNPLVKILDTSSFTKESLQQVFKDYDFTVNKGMNEYDFNNRFLWIFSFLTASNKDLNLGILDLVQKSYSKKFSELEKSLAQLDPTTRLNQEHESLKNLKREQDLLGYSFKELSDYLFKIVLLNDNYQKLVPELKKRRFWFNQFVLDGNTLEVLFEKPNYEEKMFFLLKNLDERFDFKQYMHLTSYFLHTLDNRSDNKLEFFNKLSLFLNSKNFTLEKLKTMDFEQFISCLSQESENFLDSLGKMTFFNFKNEIINSYNPEYLKYDQAVQVVLDKIIAYCQDDTNYHKIANENSKYYAGSKKQEPYSNIEFLFEDPKHFLRVFIENDKIEEVIKRKIVIPFKPSSSFNDIDILEKYLVPLLKEGNYPLNEVFNYLLTFKKDDTFTKDSKIISKLKIFLEATGIDQNPKALKKILEEGLAKYPEEMEKMEIQYSIHTKGLSTSKVKIKML